VQGRPRQDPSDEHRRPTAPPAAAPPEPRLEPGRPRAEAEAGLGPWVTPPPAAGAPPAPSHGAITPGPPGGLLDLAALAEIEGLLRAGAAGRIETAVEQGTLGRLAADRQHTVTAAASSVATVLWFDSLRAEDRVSVTPHAASLLAAAHGLLASHQAAEGETRDSDVTEGHGSVERAGGRAAAGLPATADVRAGMAGGPPGTRLALPTGRSARALRATGAGTVGPGGTVWGALARRFAGARFDHAPNGRTVCILRYPDLRDAAVWEAVTDERTPYLGELIWVVLVTGAAVGAEAEGAQRAGLAGPAGPERAARMFDAAGWQVLTLRYGRRLEGLFRRPGGQALRGRLAQMSQEEYRDLLVTRGPQLRRRLAGPGTAGAGIAGLADLLTDDEIHAALRDLGGHDLALLIDAFDEAATDRPTVLFAHTHDASTRAPGLHGSPAPQAGARGTRLASHVASYLGQPHRYAPVPPSLPADPRPAGEPHALTVTGPGPGGLPEIHGAGPGDEQAAVVSSTQAAFGSLLRGLARTAPEAASALVTVSTSDADAVVLGWLDPAAEPGPAGSPAAQASPASPAAPGERRHVAGALAPAAFAGVLGGLAAAWNRDGLPLLPIGVTDEVVAGRVIPAWAAGCAADGRSLLAVVDTGADPRFAGPGLALAAGGTAALPGVVRYQPAFTQDLAWCLLGALGRLGRAEGSSSLLSLSARAVDQRLAAVPAAGPDRARRRAAVLAGGYRLRDGGPAPVLTLVGMGPVLPEVLAAADELAAQLGAGVAVVVVTSTDLLLEALRSRDSRRVPAVPTDRDGANSGNGQTGSGAAGSEAGEDQAGKDQAGEDEAHADRSGVLTDLFPVHQRGPLVGVCAGDPGQLAFLSAVRGDRLRALGPAAPSGPAGPPGAGGTTSSPAPVDTEAIVRAALELVRSAAS